ncbi:MAG: GNAT family N-acetyltransferase [Pseudomonadota bacterium]
MNNEQTDSPNLKDIEYLTQRINDEIKDYGSAFLFGFFIRDKNNKMIAGCNGYIIFGCIYTDQLWVDSNYRNKGLARGLMNKVHEYGLEQGCKMATVNTMSFQNALKFYKKLGYTVDLERRGYNNDSSCLFLRKDL